MNSMPDSAWFSCFQSYVTICLKHDSMRVLLQSTARAFREGSPAQVLLGRLPSAGPPGRQDDAGAPGHGDGRPMAAQAAGRQGEGTSKRPIRFDGSLAFSTDPSTWTNLPAAEQSEEGEGLGQDQPFRPGAAHLEPVRRTQGCQGARPDGCRSLLAMPVHDLHRPRLAGQPSQACEYYHPLRGN